MCTYIYTLICPPFSLLHITFYHCSYSIGLYRLILGWEFKILKLHIDITIQKSTVKNLSLEV